MKMCPVEWSSALAKWKEHILMPRGECSVNSDEILDPTHAQKQEPKLEKELVAVKGPRWKLMMKLVMQAEPSTRHETRSRWSGNARRTTAHTFTPSQLPVFTDFAAQQECRGQDRATCGTSAHVNKCIFVVLSNPREVTVKENGTRRQKRIHDCDVWTFFLPASGKYKENDYLAHHVCLNYIVSFYQSKMKKKGVDLTHVLLFTDGCPGQYACRQNYQAVARFPAGPGNDSSPVKCSIKGIQLTHVIAETGDFKGVWDGGGKDSTHFIHRLERQGEIRDVSSGEMVPFSARTPFKVFDSCRSLMEAITPKPPEKKRYSRSTDAFSATRLTCQRTTKRVLPMRESSNATTRTLSFLTVKSATGTPATPTARRHSKFSRTGCSMAGGRSIRWTCEVAVCSALVFLAAHGRATRASANTATGWVTLRSTRSL